MSFACLRGRTSLRLVASLVIGLTAPAACTAIIDDGIIDTDPEEEAFVAFDSTGTLELRPKEVVTLELTTNPDATVTLLLLGDTLDASLEKAVVRADGEGRVSIDLTAPSQPTTFVARAKVGDEASAELHIAVSELGFATLKIVPVYDGSRSLEDWSADVVVAGDCAAILAAYPEGPVGALHAEGSSSASLMLPSVPVGPELAVAVRSGSLAAGCVPFTATVPDAEAEVTVTLLDRPVSLGETELEVSLDYVPQDPTGYGQMVTAAGKVVADVAFPRGILLGSAILDAMGSTVPADASSTLAAFRAGSDLDAQVSLQLEANEAHSLCWSLAAPAGELAAYDAASGEQRLEGVLVGSDEYPMSPTFELTSFAGLEPAQIGAPESLAFSWSTTADDALVISGILPISGTRLAGVYMDAALAAQTGQEGSVTEAIATALDCPTIADKILSFGEVPGCDAACLIDACTQAPAVRWQLAIAASDSTDGSLGSVQIGISGATEVSTELLVEELEGSWLGTLSLYDRQSSFAGAATGHAPPPR